MDINKLNEKLADSKEAALRWASRNGHTEIVKLLLEAGADVHAKNDGPLRLASENGHTEVVKLLLDAGTNFHADNKALRWARRKGHTEVVKLLKAHIADAEPKEITMEQLNKLLGYPVKIVE